MKRILTSIALSLLVVISSTSFAFADVNTETSSSAPVIEESATRDKAAQAVNYYLFFKKNETVDKTGASVVKVSADVIGPGTVTSTESKTITASYSSTLASNNNGIIRGTVSGSIGVSLSSSVGYSLSIESGQKGYMAFQPYRIKVTGDLKYYTSLYPDTPLSTTFETCYFPKKLQSGFADGLFYIKYI